MPKIIIREKDLTTNPTADNTAFAVVIPGFFNTNKTEADPTKVFDDNGIFETDSPSEFEEKIGKVPAKAFSVDSTNIPAHYGNQMAYELLKLGYTVLYVYLGSVSVDDDEQHAITGTDSAKTGYMSLISNTSTLFEPLKDKANYRFRYLVTGLINGAGCTQANQNILKIANRNEDNPDELSNGRGDCFALIDISDDVYSDASTISSAITLIGNEANKYKGGGKYAGIFVPSLCLDLDELDPEYLSNNKFPASFYYLACAAYSRNHSNFAEWYAVAGLTRGVCKYKVISTTLKLGESAVYALEGRKPQVIGKIGSDPITLETSVNLIIKIRDNYYLWGNRTAHELTKDDLIASNFLNIRQLCCTIKKDIYDACKKFTFDPNSDVLWVNFCNAIRPTLERMKADQGIQDYSIVKVESGRAELKALVRIVPIEAVEDFDITVTLEDSLGTTNAAISE